MDFIKYVILKSIKILTTIIIFALCYAAYESFFKEEENPKTTWYWVNDCLQDRVTYRTFKESESTVVEISNHMVGDAMISFEINDGITTEEYIKIIKSGSTTGKIKTKNKTETPNISIISVVMLKNGNPDYILQCDEK